MDYYHGHIWGIERPPVPDNWADLLDDIPEPKCVEIRCAPGGLAILRKALGTTDATPDVWACGMPVIEDPRLLPGDFCKVPPRKPGESDLEHFLRWEPLVGEGES